MSTLQLLVIAVGLAATVVGSPLSPVIDPFVDTEGVNRPSAADVCQQRMMKGPCDESIPRYYFNSRTSMCEKFDYSGCWGNGNNFKTLESCQKTCMADMLNEVLPPPQNNLFKLYP